MKTVSALKFIICFLIASIILTTHFRPPISFASHKVFQDNFDSNGEGSFPNGWLLVNDPDRIPCNATWKVINGMAGIAIVNQGSCTTNLMPSDALWSNLGDNYIFELDMKFVNGTDHNIAFRFTPSAPSNDWYDLHFQSPGDFVLERVNPGIFNVKIPQNYPNGQTYHIKITVNKNNIKVHIDNLLVVDYTAFTDRFPTGRIALRAGTGADPSSETYFDNIVVTNIDGASNGEDKFDLPFSYVGRPTNDQGVFRSAFWQRLTAAFDHIFRGGIHRPFTGNTYRVTDCLRGIVGISCYDSHNGTDFDDVPDNPVYSVGSGEVIYTSKHNENSCTPNAGGFGCVVIAQYPSQGVFGLYAHLGKISVNAGDEVGVNDELGKMGATGCPGCGSHLHFGVMKSLDSSLSSVAKSMTKHDWEALLFTIRPFQMGGFKAFCSYRAPNGQRFSFQDPSGWKGENPDPWTLVRPDGCEVESPYLWKLDVGTSSP